GPDHVTFDLADQSRMSLSFYGKRPGPGMRLDKLSMQFAMHETGWAGAVLEAYERLIYDAARGDRTLFTTAEGIERLWEISQPLLETPPAVRPYREGSWGPTQIHQRPAGLGPPGLAPPGVLGGHRAGDQAEPLEPVDALGHRARGHHRGGGEVRRAQAVRRAGAPQRGQHVEVPVAQPGLPEDRG